MSDDYQEKADQISQLSSLPPDQLIDHLSATHTGVQDAAPNIAPHVQSTAFRALNFLRSKIPPKGAPLLEDPDSEPSHAQKRAFLDYHDIVSDPTTILHRVKDGSLNSRHMEAVGAVYPQLHDEMKRQMTESLVNSKASEKSLPYSLRKSISMFMGQPLDSTMTPMSAATVMHANTGAIAQTQGRPGKPQKQSSATLKQINQVTNITATDSQRREMDKRT